MLGLPERVLYSASKGAVQSMTLAMAADWVGEGIRVNAVVPGTANTPWIGRLLEKADVAPLIVMVSLRGLSVLLGSLGIIVFRLSRS